MLFEALLPHLCRSTRESDPLSHLEASLGVFSSHRPCSDSSGFPSYLQFRGCFSFIYQKLGVQEKKRLSRANLAYSVSWDRMLSRLLDLLPSNRETCSWAALNWGFLFKPGTVTTAACCPGTEACLAWLTGALTLICFQ